MFKILKEKLKKLGWEYFVTEVIKNVKVVKNVKEVNQ